ncbi:MAG: hypothetical protein WKI04_06985 [Ferruginibacter sp.]
MKNLDKGGVGREHSILNLSVEKKQYGNKIITLSKATLKAVG